MREREEREERRSGGKEGGKGGQRKAGRQKKKRKKLIKKKVEELTLFDLNTYCKAVMETAGTCAGEMYRYTKHN